jgi:uncharacterized protein (TIGR00255 family)
MKSMTGFGKAEVKNKSGKISVEISSVNNRFLEISPRLPRSFLSMEPKVRELINLKVERGKLNIFINYEEAISTKTSIINEELTKKVYIQLSKLKKSLKADGEISLSDLLLIPDISKPSQNNIDHKVIWPSLKKALVMALNDLIKMRQKEGTNISIDLKSRVTVLKKEISRIKKLSRTSVNKYRERLNKRINDLLENPIVNNVRLEEEVALIAERTDVSEECTRFDSHLKQFNSTISTKIPVGKKLNFILQELNREANTIASKCSDIDISSNVIVMKEEIEKMREQVQNLE